MSGTRANMIKARGIVTHGSELTLPEGSQRQATNVNIDEDGVVTPRRGFNDYKLPTTGTGSSTAIVNQIMEYKNSILRQYQNEFMEYEDDAGVFQSVTGSFKTLRDGYRTKWQEANSNLFFTSDEGIKKISETSQANLNATMINDAGGIKAGYVSGTIVPTVGGFLLPESKVAYRVIYGTKDNNNNLILGSPSSRFVVTNYSADVSNPESSSANILLYGSIGVSDYFTYENSTGKYVVYFDTTGSDPEPKTANTIGGVYLKVVISGLLSSSAAAAVTANVMSAIPNTTITIDGTTNTKINLVSTEDDDIVGLSDDAYDSTGTAISNTIIDTDTGNEGTISTGSSSTVKITGVVPSNATTDYFYQVYRSSIISVSTGLEINDLDPGDELNLVYESGLTENGVDGDIDLGEFEFIDNTPESFRAEGLPLYTNEVTGEGILQSNEVPPIALDIELFRNYMFYANTKEKHRLEFTIVSVDDFVSDSTRLIVGNSDISRYYTFVGAAQVEDITIAGHASHNDGDYINIYSANDERQYYIWFDKVGDSSGDPAIAGAVGYRIDISDTPTDVQIADRIVSALVDNVDFDLTGTSPNIIITYTNNGYTTGITAGVGSGVTINPITTVGIGESSATDEGGDVLLSGLVSVGQSIDETARSLVKVISKDPESPVNAYYLSTGEDLPGNILLEARSLEDKTFYVSIEEAGNTAIGGEFTPEIPYSKEIEDIIANVSDTTIKLTTHGYSTGDLVFVGYFEDIPSDPDSFSGIYTITKTDDDNFTIPIVATGDITTPPFSTIFSADVESDNKELGNRIYYSKVSEPEAVPVANYIDIGTQDAEIKRILALRDNLFVLKDDGIYVVSGTSAPDWSVRLIDSTKILAADSAVVLNNQIYCLTEQGVTRITASGAAIISRGIENKIDLITNQGFDFASNTFGIGYENDRAYIMFVPSDESDTSATKTFRYNIFEQTWSEWEYEATCGHVMSRDNTLYVGNADRNYISKERKNNDRTDHADRNFSAAINGNGVSSNILELSTLTDIDVNDVIVQEQEVTINYVNNRLLKKMDYFDTGINPPSGSTMYDSFKASNGSNMADIMEALNDHLFTLDPANITSRSYTTSNLREYTEAFVDELNTTATITSMKTYKKPETVYYEAYIESKDVIRNQVTIHIERPFIEGSIEIYKGFTCTIEWNPQHFGDPSALKQIRYVTIMFDQNNFYEATAKFASDAAQAVTEVPFKGKGIGYWGDMPWGNPNHYWGGIGNDIPFRNPVPRGKQKCRYLSITFEHKNAREYFRILGISGVVRPISDRGYR